MEIFTSKAVFGTLITRSIAAGQTDNIIPLGSSDLTRRFEKHFIKLIEADETLMWDAENHDCLERLYRSGLRILGGRTGHPDGRVYAPSPHSGACSP